MDISYKDGEIVVRIPYKLGTGKEGEKSSTGKSRMVATTKGFVAIPNCDPSMRISINVIDLIPKGDR